MMNSFSKRARAQRTRVPWVAKGFTLLEIAVVALIIGVLVAGAFGGMQFLQRAKQDATRRKLVAVVTTLEQYRNMVGEYPTDLQELIDGPSNPKLRRRFGEPLVKEKELEDAWNQPFVYTVNPKGTRPPYEIYSIGSTGEAQIYPPGFGE